MIGRFRVGLGRDRAGLFVEVADRLDPRAPRQRFVQVHRAAAGHQEHVFDTLGRDEIDHVVGQLDHECSGLIRPP
jgi:hypothetical protein